MTRPLALSRRPSNEGAPPPALGAAIGARDGALEGGGTRPVPALGAAIGARDGALEGRGTRPVPAAVSGRGARDAALTAGATDAERDGGNSPLTFKMCLPALTPRAAASWKPLTPRFAAPLATDVTVPAAD